MLNHNDVLNKSRVFTLDEMKAYLNSAAGKDLTTREADKLLRDTLPKEGYFQSGILRWLKQTYPAAFVWKAQAGPYSRQGVPDICAIIDGRFYGFEVKRPYVGRPSKIQQATIEAIKKAGGKAGVVTWPEDARELINSK